MSMNYFTGSLVRLRPGETEAYPGKKRLDPSNAARATLDGWDVQPGKGTSDIELRHGVRAVYVARGPVDADVYDDDLFEVPGDPTTLAVIGPIIRWLRGTPLDHTVLYLEGWSG